MAGAVSRVSKDLPLFWNKLPLVSPWEQSQLQHAEGFEVAHFAVRLHHTKRPVILTAGSHHKFADSARIVRERFRVLRSKPLVVMIVPAHHNVGVRRVERIPQWFDGQSSPCAPPELN